MDQEYIASPYVDHGGFSLHPPPRDRRELRCTSPERMEKLLEIEKAVKWYIAWRSLELETSQRVYDSETHNKAFVRMRKAWLRLQEALK